jgi:hypothetical protein
MSTTTSLCRLALEAREKLPPRLARLVEVDRRLARHQRVAKLDDVDGVLAVVVGRVAGDVAARRHLGDDQAFQASCARVCFHLPVSSGRPM